MRSHLLFGSLALASLVVACGGDGSGDTGGPPPPSYLPADGLTVERVALYQGLERDLMTAGAPATSGVRVIAGRDAMMRVFYQADASYDGSPVLARLTLADAPSGAGGGAANDPAATSQTIEVAGPLLVGGSTQEDLASTVVFDVPGEALTETSTFRVELLRARAQTTGTNAKATYPSEGGQAFGATSVGAKVRIVLVPIRYDADGSGRLPDTSPEQLAIYRDVMWKMFPAPEIEIRVAEAFPWNGTVTGVGQGWGELLNAMAQHRQKSGAAFDEYYYGLFRAKETFPEFCGSACIAGLSQLALNAFNDFARVGIGIGFTGENMALTAAHEIGHEHGRGHAPCGTNQGLDAGYPHDGAAIGGWGYDLVARQLQKPSMKDFMSYCDPKWISDFTFEALATRIETVNGATMNVVSPNGAPTRRGYDRVSVGPDGSLTWLEPLELERPPVGQPETVEVATARGKQTLVGQFFPYSHLPGGTLYFEAPTGAKSAVFRGRTIGR